MLGIAHTTTVMPVSEAMAEYRQAPVHHDLDAVAPASLIEG